ncbi:HAD-IIIA family hydrolase [Microcoleus sp. B7-D4]|uniref:HAD-IIIA family hydrolase n=1 Tax=Microcoleus sp. B7-D4 TaxID=2818696 RepID=UPI002FD68A36
MNLLLLDKDGTLIFPKSGAKFVGDPWDQEPLPRIAETLKKYAADGWEMAIISNQGGVAAGHKSLENCILEMKFALHLFPQIKEAYFCPDFEGKECWRTWGDCGKDSRILYNQNSWETTDLQIDGKFRKPNAGMLLLTASFYNFDEILYVGDRPEDEGAALAANISFKWASDFFN